MKIGKYQIRDGYVIGPLVAGAFLAGAFAAGVHISYKNLKSESNIELKAGGFERKLITDGLPEHKFPILAVFRKGNMTPYITYIYESEKKREDREPAMTLISTRDNGMNDVRITNERRCEGCHKTSILKYGASLDMIGF